MIKIIVRSPSRERHAAGEESKPLNNVAVTLTEQHFDRASERGAEIFPVVRRWGLAKDGERSHDAPVIIAVTLFGSRVAGRCTLICARYLPWVMSPEGQRSVYICDNAIIGGPGNSAVLQNVFLKYLRTAALES